MEQFIRIKGARVHNLKNVNVEIPRNALVVFTGPSGSGKSSLAFDTLHAEGQRRYLESLSNYARQFLGELKHPDVDEIDGLSPVIAIDQKTVSHNPRSTVGTVTEINDYLRLLFSRVGTPHCVKCGRTLEKQSIDEIVERIEKDYSGRIIILAPLIIEKKGEYKNLFEYLKRRGFLRVNIDGNDYSLEEEIKVEKQVRHTIKLIVDRLKVSKENHQRLVESIEIALKEADGKVEIMDYEDKSIQYFSEKLACPVCGISFPELSPKLFSFNSPYGACPACGGIGYTLEVDENLVIDPDKTIRDGGIVPYKGGKAFVIDIIEKMIKQMGENTDKKIKEMSPKVRKAILDGGPGFKGLKDHLMDRYRYSDSEEIKEWIEKNFLVQKTCSLCHGKRLRDEALTVTFREKNIAEISDMTIKESYDFFNNLELSQKEESILKEILMEIKRRLKFLIDVGLDYLTLSRAASTLSGGESQRIKLATQLGSRLVGVLYILDEPTIGLHQKDTDRLIKMLEDLKELGNTVIVVEHDEQVIKSADFAVDIGPGAGENGGNILYAGDVKGLISSDTLTGKYLSKRLTVPIPAKRRNSNEFLRIKGITHNNLKSVDVSIPLGTFTCVTGVSGSGKSSLVMETLYPVLMNRIYKTHLPHGTYESIEGSEKIDKVILVDQSPIGRTPRSNPATYTKAFDGIREIFALTEEARIRGYTPGRFSFNVKGGRCEACAGQGVIKVEMNFMPDVYVECDVCNGKRYNKETLEVKYKGKDISEILEMSVDEALRFFSDIPKITAPLKALQDVGLGYIRLGQSATTLSGGEAQRIKLSSELRKISTGKTLYILDEPTTGLHFHDVKKLVNVLQKLVDKGNTVVVVEHNLDVIKNADYIIDLGPDGGENGGQIVAQGTPEEVTKSSKSYTGMYLRQILNEEMVGC
ncbi:MAG: excinuclease ABC subunit UvrA [Mesoaciditoga sp.]|uniref:excinuclease ABC subunit UvrA n=1 Tax=Athalassotoga sp. TaxID=2022597 RepID=UPI000CBBC354|nr:MAG: excinuclease ABC subunit UvrA [Mesoaciditoga sp.]PMP80341.1 MAG: excinuclease ABC subunit UvrA [Mesoaciditoga sp.]HEU25062.1 excinuclease ABC subunit UvrA [Mesoaciditoga lauensis]